MTGGEASRLTFSTRPGSLSLLREMSFADLGTDPCDLAPRTNSSIRFTHETRLGSLKKSERRSLDEPFGVLHEVLGVCSDQKSPINEVTMGGWEPPDACPSVVGLVRPGGIEKGRWGRRMTEAI